MADTMSTETGIRNESNRLLCGLHFGSANLNSTLPLVDPPFISNFEWEKFDNLYWAEWMGERWWWSIVFASIYVPSIFLGQKWMRDRQPMALKSCLFFWNVGLAVLSVTMCLRTLPELLSILGSENGFHKTVCTIDDMSVSHLFWEWIGTWSKVVELGDTAFIILRKQPLIFLHWYHHTTVLIYTWYSLGTNDPAHRWYMTMNTGVHAFMYTYYALRAIGIKIPRKLALSITTIQILQMITGFWVNIYTVYAKASGYDCCRPESNITYALAMYTSYLILFLNFFYKTYLGPKKSSLMKKDEKKIS